VLGGGSHRTIRGGEEGSRDVAEGNRKVKEGTRKVEVKGYIAKEEAIMAMLGELDHYWVWLRIQRLYLIKALTLSLLMCQEMESLVRIGLAFFLKSYNIEIRLNRPIAGQYLTLVR
jgi:hypothetical protein